MQSKGDNFYAYVLPLISRLHDTDKVEAESLLEEKNYMNPTPWSSEKKLCVCPNALDAINTPRNPLCSANEENTCTIPIAHKGKKLDHAQRPKRGTGEYVNLDVERRVSRLRRGIAEQHAIHRKRVGVLYIAAPNASVLQSIHNIWINNTIESGEGDVLS